MIAGGENSILSEDLLGFICGNQINYLNWPVIYGYSCEVGAFGLESIFNTWLFCIKSSIHEIDWFLFVRSKILLMIGSTGFQLAH